MTEPTTLRAWFSETAIAAVAAAAKAAHPVEAGGVLLGVYTHGGRPWITEAVAVSSGAATGNFYELPAGARHEAVDKARVRDSRLGYLGDWHSHPANVGPSSVDLAAMCNIAEDNKAESPEPVLLIARRTASGGYTMDARQFARHRRLTVAVASDLPTVQVTT